MLEYTLKSKLITENQKTIVWENENFVVSTSLFPHVCKFDGGHLTIRPKNPVGSLIDLSDDLLFGIIKIVQVCEKALLETLNAQGIETPFTNNMDNGNWAVFANKPKSLHFHIYGRAINSKKQIFGQVLYFPDPHSTFYDSNQPLSQKDIEKIKKSIETQFANSN